MADLDKRLKDCRGDMGDLNKKMNESNKRNLMIHSDSIANYKSGPRRPTINSQSPINIIIGGGGYPISSTSIVVGGDSKMTLTKTCMMSRL